MKSLVMSVMSVISVISVNVTLNVTFWWSHVHTSLRNSNVVFQVLKKKVFSVLSTSSCHTSTKGEL